MHSFSDEVSCIAHQLQKVTTLFITDIMSHTDETGLWVDECSTFHAMSAQNRQAQSFIQDRRGLSRQWQLNSHARYNNYTHSIDMKVPMLCTSMLNVREVGKLKVSHEAPTLQQSAKGTFKISASLQKVRCESVAVSMDSEWLPQEALMILREAMTRGSYTGGDPTLTFHARRIICTVEKRRAFSC